MGPVLSRNETKQCMHNVSRQFRPSSAQPWWWRRCWSLICKIHLRYARESRAHPGDLRADQFGRNLIITMQSRFQTVSWAHKDDQPEDEMTLMDKYWIADSCWQKYVICDFTFNFVSRKKWSMLADVFFLPFAYKQTHLLSFQLSLLSTGQVSQRTVCMIPGSMAAPTFNLCEVKKYEHGSETSGRGRKFWSAPREDLLRNLKGFDQRPSAGEKVTVLFEPLYMYDLSFISALGMTFSYFSTKSL